MTRVDDLARLETWAAGLLADIEPGARARLARKVATDLRRSQQRRIAAQRNPDGSPYVPRKREPLRGKAGRIKRGVMFKRLRGSGYLRTRADAAQASVEFTGRTARIARVHQFGQVDKVRPNGPRAAYARRELLGFTKADIDTIRAALIAHLRG